MIFAAGLGTRLKPITDNLPKALVPVAGMPLIEHVARKLKASGIEEAVVNVHHFADMLEDWVAGHEILPMKVSDERERLLETGGAVLHARKHLEGCGTFLVHNVDIISDLDVRDLCSEVKPEALATLLVSERETARYLLFEPETMKLVGWTNILTGEVRSPYAGLDPASCRRLAFSGIHVMSDTVFEAMDRYVAENGLDDGKQFPRFPVMDFYLSVCDRYDIYGVKADDLHLVDVGKLDTIQEAENMLKTIL